MTLGRGLRHVALPSLCHFCEDILQPDENHFCMACQLKLPTAMENQCIQCGAEIGPNLDSNQGCVHCNQGELPLKKVISLGAYKGLMEQAIRKIKFLQHEGLAECLGIQLGERIKKTRLSPDLVAPIPQHWRRWLQRGYNQAETIGRMVARVLRIPMVSWAIMKKVATLPQRGLPSTRRKANLKGCFAVHPKAPVRGKHILLVDDVLTTGSTCTEAFRELLRSGAAEVSAGVLARATGGNI